MKSTKKQIIIVFAVLTMALVLSCAFVACNKTDTTDAPKKEFTITFDTQGGSEVKPLVLKEGETLTLPSNPTKEGSVFDGWYLDSLYAQAFDITKRIDSNMVLYAKWRILDDGKSIIASDYFDINGLVLTMNKKNYITSTEDVFDLQNKFSTSIGSSWRAFTSPNCDQPTEITTRTANVSAGWNNIYVMVENLTTYENQIYRLKIYKYPTIVYKELEDGFWEIQSVSDCADVLFPHDKIDNITSIGERAFSSCPSLRTLPNLPKLTYIGPSAFANCKRLTSITIPDSVTSIGPAAFGGCSSLESITIPFVGAKAGVTSSDTYQYPFGYIFGTSSYDGGVATKQYYYGDSTSSTTSTTYYIPSSLKSVTVTGGNILYGAFYGCSGLTSVTIGKGVTSIGDWAFYNCTGLTSITIPDSVTSIGWNAFYGCTGLTSVTIGKGVTSIGHEAFYKCTGLTSITIPDSVTSIGSSAFSGCTGLTSVTIPDRVTSIGNSVFSYCTGLTSITVAKGNTKYHSAENCLIGTESKTLIAGCKNSIIPTDGSVTSIGYMAFEGCTGLTSVTIPDSVTSIGFLAFANCTGLTSVTIPDSVTSIGYEAFLGCTGLTSITVAKGNTKYHSAGNCLIETESKTLIAGCKNSIIPTDGSVTSISSGAFSRCTGLTSVTIGKGVTSIGDDAFYGCTGLTSITIPDSVTSIGDLAFYGCTGLTSINFNGTKEQWNAISKGSYWKYNVPATQVICTGGTVSI